MRAVGLSSPTANTKGNDCRPFVFLTGASGKIGIKILKILLELDYGVIAQCSKNEKIITDFLEKNPQYKDFVEILNADFKEDSLKIVVSMKKNNLVCLINSAAVFEKGNLTDFHNLVETIQINDIIPAELTTRFAEKVNKGSVINISDGNIYNFNENYQNYRISKLLLEEITKQSAILYAPKIRVNAIALGMLETDENPSNIAAKQKEILKEEISDKNLAQTIEFLITCENITGQIIYLDNGVHLV